VEVVGLRLFERLAQLFPTASSARGVLREERGRRPELALDVIEVFRESRRRLRRPRLELLENRHVIVGQPQELPTQREVRLVDLEQLRECSHAAVIDSL
jgi:chromatin segregation and condensation protein Rec8/ScpA/Scc1 (kleisin family)